MSTSQRMGGVLRKKHSMNRGGRKFGSSELGSTKAFVPKESDLRAGEGGWQSRLHMQSGRAVRL